MSNNRIFLSNQITLKDFIFTVRLFIVQNNVLIHDLLMNDYMARSNRRYLIFNYSFSNSFYNSLSYRVNPLVIHKKGCPFGRQGARACLPHPQPHQAARKVGKSTF